MVEEAEMTLDEKLQAIYRRQGYLVAATLRCFEIGECFSKDGWAAQTQKRLPVATTQTAWRVTGGASRDDLAVQLRELCDMDLNVGLPYFFYRIEAVD